MVSSESEEEPDKPKLELDLVRSGMTVDELITLSRNTFFNLLHRIEALEKDLKSLRGIVFMNMKRKK